MVFPNIRVLDHHFHLDSIFNLEYIQKEIESYHDIKLLDYLTLAFPLVRDRITIAWPESGQKVFLILLKRNYITGLCWDLLINLLIHYVSALKFAFSYYGWNIEIFSHPLVVRLLRGITLSVDTSPSLKGLFSFHQIHKILSLCDLFESSLTYWCVFLLGVYGLLLISNVAPTSHNNFDSSKQLLRRDVVFAYPASHIRIKWAKNLQNPEKNSCGEVT